LLIKKFPTGDIANPILGEGSVYAKQGVMILRIHYCFHALVLPVYIKKIVTLVVYNNTLKVIDLALIT
jgi:hypothetical protein